MTQQVFQATADQKRGGKIVVNAMAHILEISRDNLSTVEETSKASADLARQAEELATLTAAFKAE
jgi:methyl-accepting chemotaxis protein